MINSLHHLFFINIIEEKAIAVFIFFIFQDQYVVSVVFNQFLIESSNQLGDLLNVLDFEN